MAGSDDPKLLNRSDLAKFLPDQRAIRAFEQIFKLIPSDLVSLQTQVNNVNLSAEQANNNAIQALDALQSIAKSLALIALQSEENELSSNELYLSIQRNTVEEQLNLYPNYELGTISYQNEDNVNISGGTITASITDDSSNLIASSTTLSNNAGAGAGTLSNAPTAGDPTKWITIDDNGTTRYIPTWT